MQIEERTLIVSEAIDDEMCEEFIALTMQPEIETVHLQTNQVASSIMQALFCMCNTKKIVCDDPFLAKMFERLR
ncbi:MAG: hypothetical protein B6D59_08130 [Campylobacteraceae bacterium 4484_4]|nr:MAG: hypothetical protein B6D59_08130 [Campylobacteraceae bacterium 4484_4]